MTTLEQVLDSVVRLTTMLAGVPRCAVLLREEPAGAYLPAAAYGLSPGQQAAFKSWQARPGDVPAFDPAGAGRLPVSGQGPADGPLAQLGFASPLWLPLLARGEVLGCMLVEPGNTWPPTDSAGQTSEDQLAIVRGIAQQTALAIQNDRLQHELAGRQQLERELQLAHQIQRTFMPSQPLQVPGWELAVIWRAAHQVGGDFYDFFELPGQRLGLVIADVADKGIPAALYMAVSRAMLRAVALEDTRPAAALERVNDLLAPDAPHGMFVTAVYAVLSPTSGQLAYANAGHLRPLIWRSRHRQLQTMPKGGIALGVLEGIQLPEQSVVLEPGDCLIMYTDGVIDALSPQDEFYGEPRLRQTVQSAPARSAAEMLAAIDDSVTGFVGDTPPADDLTLLVLWRQPG
jgi:serine phosphatase RsbU (regulator of sigma subunit)